MSDPQEAVGRRTLTAIHARLSADRAPPGFSGKVAIGVRDGEGELWLGAELGTRAIARLGTARHGAADVTLLLGEYEFSTLVRTAAPPADAKLFELSGDVEILGRFLSRYLMQQDALSIRSQQARRL
jgi:hypothetical protein